MRLGLELEIADMKMTVSAMRYEVDRLESDEEAEA